MARKANNNAVDIYHLLDDFQPVRGRFDSWIFTYGPLLVLGLFNITGLAVIVVGLYNAFHTNPQPVFWTNIVIHCGMFLTLFIEFIAFRNFLERIREVFSTLWQEGIVETECSQDETASRFASFLKNFERSLCSRRRLLLGWIGVAIGLSFCWKSGFLPLIFSRWFDGSDVVTKLITTFVGTIALVIPASMVGYTMGIGAWISLITGLYVHRFGKEFSIVVQPSHPDQAGGLKPLGDLIFAMAAILVIASLALSGLTIYADYVDFYTTQLFARILLASAVVLSLIAFLLPLLTIHNRMVDEKKQLKALLAKIARRIADLEREAQTNFYEMNHEKRKDVFDEIDSLKELYQRSSHMPTWPFNRDIVLRFATPQVFSLLSLVGITDPIIRAINSVLSSLAGK